MKNVAPKRFANTGRTGENKLKITSNFDPPFLRSIPSNLPKDRIHSVFFLATYAIPECIPMITAF